MTGKPGAWRPPEIGFLFALLHRCGFYQAYRAARTFRINDRWGDSIYLRLECASVAT